MDSKNSDKRLLQAYELIRTHSIDVLSLDIFDTLLWRKLPLPQDLFLLLGQQLKEEGWLIPAATAETFSEMRRSVEKTAREEKNLTHNIRELHLAEIYWRLQNVFVQLSLEEFLRGDKKGIYESDISAPLQKEIELEKALIEVDLNILHLLQYAKKEKLKIILVSDTYFDENSLKMILEPHIPIENIDAFYLSCEFGFNKQEGLLESMLTTLNLPASRVLHIGDSKEHDYLTALNIGLHAILYSKQSSELEEIFKREWPEDLKKRQLLLDPMQGDFGMTTARGRIVYHKETIALNKEHAFFWNYGATVLGPILLSFIHWIYSRCSQMKADRVFCLMREGRLYARLINHFAPCFPQHILKTQELWVSRHFITHAALEKANRKELSAVMKAFLEYLTVEQYCQYLGVQLKELPKWEQRKHMFLDNEELKESLLKALLKNSTIRQIIVCYAAHKRQRFLNYLSTLIPIQQENQFILVDVGWNGTAQSSLNTIFQLNALPLSLYGLYLGTTQKTQAALLKGIHCEGFLFKGGYPGGCVNAYSKGCFVLEQTATAETGLGPLENIDAEGTILTHPFLIPKNQTEQAKCIQKGIFAFFDQSARAIQKGSLVLDTESEPFTQQIREIFLRSMLNPTQKEAKKFGPWLHEHGPSSNLTQVIGKHTHYDKFIHHMLPTAAFKESTLNWPAAYTAKRGKFLTLTNEALLLKKLPPECLLSEDYFSLKIYLGKKRQNTKKAAKTIKLRSNPNRQFYALEKLVSTKHSIESIQFQFPYPETLIRIHTLRLTVYDKHQPQPFLLHFFEKKSPAIEYQQGIQIDFNTFYSMHQLHLSHTFYPSFIYQIKVHFCCEIFKFEMLKKFFIK